MSVRWNTSIRILKKLLFTKLPFTFIKSPDLFFMLSLAATRDNAEKNYYPILLVNIQMGVPQIHDSQLAQTKDLISEHRLFYFFQIVFLKYCGDLLIIFF